MESLKIPLAFISRLSRLIGMLEKLVHCFLSMEWRIMKPLIRIVFFPTHLHTIWVTKMLIYINTHFYLLESFRWVGIARQLHLHRKLEDTLKL